MKKTVAKVVIGLGLSVLSIGGTIAVHDHGMPEDSRVIVHCSERGLRLKICGNVGPYDVDLKLLKSWGRHY
jgi:hypothetical protein